MIGKFVLLLATVVVATAEEVPVTIYYESLCQDSKDFFTKQFVPTWRDLKEFIKVELVPFGKSNSTDYNHPPQFPPLAYNANFTCHHGLNECVGNKYQACVLNSNYRFEDQINYINCLMTKGSIPTPYDQTASSCSSEPGSAISAQNLQTCVRDRGNELLLKYERTTNEFQKPIVSVPTIVFHKRYTRAESDDAVKSFRGALCKHITTNPKPKACEGSGASAATAGLMALLTAGLVIRML